jgi:hypothetical protein
MPADFKLIEARQPPLKDMYDEWLARIICYAFSVPASPFVSQVNRATSETLRLQATQEGLIPLKAWVKSALDHVIQVCMNEPGLEFVWVGDDAIDPLQQAQTLNILVTAGIKTREEARADLGLGGEGGKPVEKWTYDPDQPRDERGRWTRERESGARDDSSDGTNAKPRPKEDVDRPPTHSPPGVQLSAAAMLSCSEAFRACVQQAVFASSPPLNNCFRARDVCLATGLPTIFAPGTIGKN